MGQLMSAVGSEGARFVNRSELGKTQTT
jgi:hypothetical protein